MSCVNVPVKITPIFFGSKGYLHPIPWVRDIAIVHSSRLRV